MKAKSGILPWTKSCFVCGEENPHGLRLKSKLENNIVILEYTTGKRDLGWRHLVHGGIAMTLLDEVMTWAAIVATGHPCVAAELTIRLKKPIETGLRIRAESKTPDPDPKLLKTKGVLLNEKKEILASAEGKYMRMPQEKVSLCSEDFITGPDTIDPRLIMKGL
ncbi:PaaI family thioesterase [Verrucomicrobiota bacterium]